jgi:competence protein ComEC
MRYAGLRAFGALAIGIAVQSWVYLPTWFLLVLTGLALAAAFWTRGYSLLLSLLGAGALYYGTHAPGTGPVPYNRSTQFEATVLDEPMAHAGSRVYAVELTRMRSAPDYLPLGLKARLSTGLDFRYGDRITFKGRLLPFHYPRNPGVVDLNRFYQRQGFAGRIRAQTSPRILPGSAGSPLLRLVVMPVRRHFVEVIGLFFQRENRALLAGLLLGDKADLTEETRTAFRRTGLTHLLAVSGLNVAILVGICLLLLMVLDIRGFAGLATTVILTMLYVGITGFSASALRAGLMAITAGAGVFIQRRYDPVNGISVAGIFLLVLDPFSLLDVGFQLSFAATAAIVLFFPLLRELYLRLNPSRRFENWVLSPLAVTLCGTLGTLPLIAVYFHQVSLVSLLANLLAVPLVALATPLGMLLMVAARVSSVVAGWLAATLDSTLSLLLWLVKTSSTLPWAVATVGRVSPLAVVWYYALLLFAPSLVLSRLAPAPRGPSDASLSRAVRYWLLVLRNRHKSLSRVWVATALSGLAAIVWYPNLQRPKFEMTFLDTGTGAATLCRFPSGRTLLVDAGNPDINVVQGFLQSKGLDQLDALVLTSRKATNLAAAEELARQRHITVAILPGESEADGSCAELGRLLRGQGARVAAASRGMQIKGLGGRVSVLAPRRSRSGAGSERRASRNRLSSVVKLEYAGLSVLFPGDLDQPELLDRSAARARVLVSPRLGSVPSNSERLLATVRPGVLVVPARFRIADKLKLRLDRFGIRVCNLRQNGAAVLTLEQGQAVIRRPGTARDF